MAPVWPLALLLPVACSSSPVLSAHQQDEALAEAREALSLLQIASQSPRRLRTPQSRHSVGIGADGSTSFVEPLDARDLLLAGHYAANEPRPPNCTNPHSGDWNRPIREVLDQAKAVDPEMDGSCYFQAMTSCAVAHRRRDFFEFSATWPSAFTGLIGRVTPRWRDALMTTEPHVFVYDAEYCLAAGWVDVEPEERERLLRNYSAIQEKTWSTCGNYSDRIENLTAFNGNKIFPRTDAEVERQSRLSPDQRPGFMDPENVAAHQAWHCAIGTADCMMHFCLWTYCRTSSGTIGMGQQCRSDWRLKPLHTHPAH